MTGHLNIPRFTEQALCSQTDPEVFFPETGGDPESLVRQARRMCGMCDAQEECLAWALRNEEEFGVWGGATPRERRAILRQTNRPRRLLPIAHGSAGGARAHYRQGSKPCRDCMDAARIARPSHQAKVAPAPANKLPREHGTARGYYQHRDRKDMPPCHACRTANSERNRLERIARLSGQEAS